MVAIKNILLFISAATALAIVKRDTATILTDISTIDTNVNALTTAVNNYNGGILAAIPVASAESTLDTSIQQGTTDAKATPALSSADSQSIITAIDSLLPDIQTSLTALKSKKTQFAADGLTSLVQGDLASLKTDTDAFSDALIAITSADLVATATAQKATVDEYFEDAITYYAS